MVDVVISGTGLYHPEEVISNEELVNSFNAYVTKYNHQHAAQIEAGEMDALRESAVDFIEKASGIKQRYARSVASLLDPDVMYHQIEERDDSELCLQAEAGLIAAKQALKNANKKPEDIDAVIVACTHKQRDYPAIAIEIQNALGIKGYAYDMGCACSSATFGLQTAVDAVKAGSAKAVLVITPEIGLTQINFRDRDSHFIFGEANTAVVVESAATCQSEHSFRVVSTELVTNFSNNIRNNSGAYIRATPDTMFATDKAFYQQGRKVFKEVTPMVIQLITEWLAKQNLQPADVARYWLHQANSNMNRIITEKLIGKDYSNERAPVILDEFGNIGAAGSVVSFHRHHDNLNAGDYGVLCSFGAGYSVGCLILEKR
jgi:beta-ketodecanoyl-[acyl-carrier-protein] synthase